MGAEAAGVHLPGGKALRKDGGVRRGDGTVTVVRPRSDDQELVLAAPCGGWARCRGKRPTVQKIDPRWVVKQDPENLLATTVTAAEAKEAVENHLCEEARKQLLSQVESLKELEGRLHCREILLIYRPLWCCSSNPHAAWIDGVSGRLLLSTFPPSGLRRWIRHGLALPARLKALLGR